MRRYSPGILIFALLTLFLWLPAAAEAHNLWLNATDFTPAANERVGAHSKVYFGFGHRFPVDDFLDAAKVREFRLIGPDGSAELQAQGGGFLATPLRMKRAGAYTVTTATNTGFYTMFENNGRIQHASSSMEGVDNVILSLYFENYAKALIAVGDTAAGDFTEPVGHNIEIVPLENPYHKRAGDYLPVQVLLQGRPARYATVSATYMGFSSEEEYAFSSKTNSQGIARVRLLAPGHWVLLSVVRTPPAEDIRDQCLEMKYSAALSFGVH